MPAVSGTAKSQLSLIGIPGPRYTFVAKAEASTGYDGKIATGYTSTKPGHLFPLQSVLLLENGYYLLLENGDYILLEHQVQLEQAFVSAQPKKKFSDGKPTVTFS